MGEKYHMNFPSIAHLSLSESLQHVIEGSDIDCLVRDTRDYDAHDELDEINMYASLDPVLADLLKQYKDADKQSQFLGIAYSQDDPMAEIAHDRRDSAWSMVQTRIIELRGDETFAGQVGILLMRLEEERAGLIPRLKDQKIEEDFLVRDKQDARAQARDKKDHETDILMFFLWMWISKQWAEKTRDIQQQLQQSFTQAA